jgi:hypothetical protein
MSESKTVRPGSSDNAPSSLTNANRRRGTPCHAPLPEAPDDSPLDPQRIDFTKSFWQGVKKTYYEALVAGARERGSRVTGTLGVLAGAATRGFVDLATMIDRLRKTNFRTRQRHQFS